MDIKDTEKIVPPSPLQEAILLDSSDPHLACGQLECVLEGSVDGGTLGKALVQMADRHSILRTFFLWKRVDRPLQVVYRQRQLALEQHDWRDRPIVEQQEQLQTLLRRDRERGFDPGKAPLLRVTLCRTAEATYRLIVTYHRTILDSTSAELFVRELLKIYAGGAEQPASDRASYSDYVASMKHQDASQADNFWKAMLANVSAPTPLAMERFSATLSDQPADFGEKSRQLSATLMSRLEREAKETNVAAVVHGAWALLLSRYTGDEEIIFGTNVETLPSPLRGSVAVLGPFTNALPLRVGVSRDIPVKDWLEAIKAQIANVEKHAYTSLTAIHRLADLPFTAPLFGSCVIQETEAGDGVSPQQYGNLTLRDITHGPPDFSLTVGYPLDSGVLRIRYDRRRFDDNAIVQLLEHLEILLNDLTSDTDRPLSAVSLLTEAAERQLLVDWNDRNIGYRQDQCVHWLIEAQVEKTPNESAVVFENEHMTYEELNERANQLAHYLQSFGVGPDVLVAICMERSFDLITGILAILKAGGAWVPLDPGYPADRIGFMLEDAQPPLLLTHERVLDGLPSHWGQVVCVDTDHDKIERQSKQNPVSPVSGANLAYVMYTSGSTGKPKGAMVHHRGICNTAEEMVRVFDQKPGTRLLQFASVSFDMSVFDIVPALISGATLFLARQDSVLGEDLGKMLREQRIESLTIPPSVLATVPEGDLPDLKIVRVAGEAVTAELVTRWLPGRRVYNAYGPAEGSIWVSGAFVDASNHPNIGRPIANTQIYVLDPALRPVPVGVPGEIYFSGVGVCRGYLSHPEATAEKFIPNPFSDEPGDRLYRTGDRARYLSDGSLEFLGRTDDQETIRGFRIELGEIESILATHPSARRAAVVAREDVPGDKRLVAYVVPGDDQDVTPSELRNFLRTKLPEPMIPSAFVLLTSMPLTANGKLDRAALPAPDFDRPHLEMAFVAPRNETEKLLATVFADVLGIDEVGVDDNFFDLGGHSLLATQLISRIRTTFNVELPLAHVFRGPTVGELSKLIEKDQDQDVEIQPPIAAVPRKSQHA